MGPDELVAMSIFFGSIVAVIFIIVVGSIIKAWLKKGSAKNLSENQEFLNALREFKENMERRMSNLEEIVSGENLTSATLKSDKEKKNSQRTIELELDNESAREKKSTENMKLKNMLNQ